MSSQQDSRLFEDRNISAAYKKYRPTYTGSNISEKIITFLREKHPGPYDLGIDLGCGSGQSSHLLADHFRNVIGIDCSESQINEARRANTGSNVTFRCGDERSLGCVADCSVDLVFCAQSIHWMDHDVLNPELRRILKPGGCLAAYGDFHPYFNSKERTSSIDSQLQAIWSQITEWLRPYQSKKVDMLTAGYVDLPLPFEEHRRFLDLNYSQDITVDGIIGLTESFSYYNQLIKEQPEQANVLQQYKTRFLDVISKVSDTPEEYKMKLTSTGVLVMSRKPSADG